MIYCRNIIVYLTIMHTLLVANDFNNLKTFEASFTQTITNPSGNEVIYNGLLHIKEPDKIKWKYENPIEKFVYINKYTVTIIEPELEQAILTKLNQEINILNLLKNAKQINGNSYQSEFNNIKYSLILNNKILTQISYTDEIENQVLISFSNVKQNKTIDDNTFKFTIPIEYDVIKK